MQLQLNTITAMTSVPDIEQVTTEFSINLVKSFTVVFAAIAENIFKESRQKKHGQCLYFGENEENKKVKSRLYLTLNYLLI